MVCLPIEMDAEVEEIIDNGDYVIKRKGGRSLIDKPPKFSPDETCLFIISGRGIQIYDVGTAEFVRSLKDKSNSFPIVGMGFPPNDDRTLITCTEDGSVVRWKWHAAVQSSKIMLNLPEESRLLSFDLISADKAVIGFVKNSKAAAAVISLAENGSMQKASLRRMNSSVGPRWSVAIGWFGEHNVVAVSEGTSFVNVFDVEDPTKCMCHAVSQGIATTDLSWHPTQDILAVGDTLGRVSLWRGPMAHTQPAREVRHWHHLPLAAVTYSVMGGILLSGGAERVMVAWDSGDSRRFVPRLPAEILHITSSSSRFVVSTADNGIQIIDSSSLYVIGCIREAGGLGGARRLNGSLCPKKRLENVQRKGPALQYAQPATALLLPAGPGHLHTYSTVTDSLVYTLDVTNTNIVPPERDNLQPEQIEVMEMSVGCRGQWLCTWEGRGEQERLRWFGFSSRGDRGWSLHTVMARPHRPAGPSALHVATDVSMAVTFDDGNQLRFWTLVDSIPGYEGKPAWCTVAQGAPSGGAAGGAALSGDGSVCAAWSGPRLTLWDTHKGRQKACLSHPALRPQGRSVQFGRDHHMHFVACTTDTSLAVWNTLSLRLIWIVQLNTSFLIADPFSDRVAAVTNENDVFIFRMSSSRPLVTLLEALPPKRGSITSAAFAPSLEGPTDFRLYLLRDQQEIFVLERSELESTSQTLEKLPIDSRPAPSAYSAMMAEKKSSMIRAKQKADSSNIVSTRAAIAELLLSTPAHVQPSLRTICGPLLRAVAGSHRSSHTTQDDVKVEIKMEVDKDDNREVKQFQKSLKKLEEESMEWARHLLDVET